MASSPCSQSTVTPGMEDEDDTATLRNADGSDSDDDDVATLAGEHQQRSQMIMISSQLADDPSLFVLTLEDDDPQDTRLFTSQGRLLYTIGTCAEGGNKHKPSQELVTRLTNQGTSQLVASYTRPSKRGTDSITIGDERPVKRPTWLSSGSAFSQSIGTFKHRQNSYRWVKQQQDNTITLELRSKDNPEPLARFIDSRRDWSIPPPTIVIQKARLELTPEAVEMIDIVVFSWIVTEMLRRERTPTSLSIQNASARAGAGQPLAFFTI